MKLLVGMLLGALIGVGCRLFEMPLPGPNAVLGALLGIAMASGYQLTDRVLLRRSGISAGDPSAQGARTDEAPASSAKRDRTTPVSGVAAAGAVRSQ
jgi:XapX domain-containing protein